MIMYLTLSASSKSVINIQEHQMKNKGDHCHAATACILRAHYL